MDFFKKIFSGKPAGSADETDAALFIYLRCEKCGDIFRSRIDKEHDLVQNFDDGPPFSVRKELIGARCRRAVIVELEFDQRKKLVERRIENGRFISREEFNALEFSLK